MERFQKKHFVIGAALIYFILIVVFVVFEENVSFSKVCFAEQCVRFCCRNETNCNEKFIKENFNGSERGLNTDYEIILGSPKCNEKLMNPADWTFTENGEIIGSSSQPTDRYCFQESSNIAPVSWSLFVCDSKILLRQVIHYFLHLLSTLLLASGIVIYFYFGELRSTNHGASVKYLLIGMFLMYASVLSFQAQSTIGAMAACLGLCLSFLWMTVLSFDLWWTIKNSQPTLDESKRFKYYCAYAFGVLGLVILSIIGLFGSSAFLIDYVLLIFAGFVGLLVLAAIAKVVLLILSTIKLMQMAKNLNNIDQNWFEEQTKRFWMYLQVYAIMLITGGLELHSQPLYRSTESMITQDVLKFFSAFLIFAIFVLDEDVRSMVTTRYEMITRES